jgi:alanyl aminopeptidase
VIRSALGLLFEPGIEPRELQTVLFDTRDGGRQVVWQFVKENFERLNSTLPGARGIPFGATLPRAAMDFCDTESADDVETFFRNRIAKLSGGRRNLANVLERIRVCAARADAMRPAAIAFLQSQ